MKTALIGTGYWGSILKEKLSKISDLMFIADSKTDIKKLPTNIDFVFVCTPTTTHYDIVKFCLLNGQNVFCEKPFTGCYNKAFELINLAKEKKLNLIIDHVFLYRSEYKKLFNGNKFKFIWNKPEVIKQNILNSLLYHDLYILIDTTKVFNWNIGDIDITNETLNLKLFLDEKNIEIVYNRACNYKEKKILIDDVSIDFSIPTNDALYDFIKNIIDKSVDMESNNSLCLKTLMLKNKIENNTNHDK